MIIYKIIQCNAHGNKHGKVIDHSFNIRINFMFLQENDPFLNISSFAKFYGERTTCYVKDRHVLISQSFTHAYESSSKSNNLLQLDKLDEMFRLGLLPFLKR